MATIATRAILNNRNLTGAEINVRESIASFAATYAPYTSALVKEIAERIGMDTGQCSNVLKDLETKGEIGRTGKTIYLLRLDDYQLETIASDTFDLLVTLAALGCAEAKLIHSILTDRETALCNIPKLEKLKSKGSKEAALMIESISKEIENDSTSEAFLLHFFLYSNLSMSHLKLNHTQSEIESYSSLNESDSIALKEDNALKVSSNGSNVSFYNDSVNPESLKQANSANGSLPPFDSSSAGTQTNKADESKKGLDDGKNGNSPPNQGKPRQPAKNTPADERKDHPAIRCVLRVAKRYPPKDLWDAVIKALGDKPDEEFFESCYVIWRSVNGSPMNYERWLFEPARTGKSPHVFRPENNPGNSKTDVGRPPDQKSKIVEALTDPERVESLNWLKTKADWYFYDDQFLPDDWAWLKARLEEEVKV